MIEYDSSAPAAGMRIIRWPAPGPSDFFAGGGGKTPYFAL
jgi:hypothetical protein